MAKSLYQSTGPTRYSLLTAYGSLQILAFNPNRFSVTRIEELPVSVVVFLIVVVDFKWIPSNS